MNTERKEMLSVVDETLYVWVAPDGNIQLCLNGPSLQDCIDIACLFTGSKTPKELIDNGFTMRKVKVNIEAMDNVVIDTLPEIIEQNFPEETE